MMKEKNSKQTKGKWSLLRTGKLMLITGIALMISASTFAQNPLGDPDGTDVPFDGGVSLLVAAGISYGAKQWHNARKNTKATEENGEKAEA